MHGNRNILADDTICAPATAPGQGAVGIVRLSGPEAVATADRHFTASAGISLTAAPSHTVHHGHFLDAGGTPVDEVLVLLMLSPRSYTTQDVVEIQCHGGGAAVQAVLGCLVAAGCRMAEPGEFTRRAFLAGRIDLTQAEAVLEVIEARTDLAQRLAQRQLDGTLSRELARVTEALRDLVAHLEAAIDFPEDDLEEELPAATVAALEAAHQTLADVAGRARAGNLVKEGVRLAILGRPNVGKSSLLNAMLGHDRAIVTDVPGTTRDVLEAELVVDGIRFVVQDTAGIRDPGDAIEAEGIARSRRAAAGADLVLLVLDGAQALDNADRTLLHELDGARTLLALNKSDLPTRLVPPGGREAVPVSAHSRDGIDTLRAALVAAVRDKNAAPLAHAFLVTLRQRDAIERAATALGQALSALRGGAYPELVATDLRGALDAVGEVTGETTTDDLLDRIFSRFCIGK